MTTSIKFTSTGGTVHTATYKDDDYAKGVYEAVLAAWAKLSNSDRRGCINHLPDGTYAKGFALTYDNIAAMEITKL